MFTIKLFKIIKKKLINKSIKIKKIVSAASSLANKDKKILLKKNKSL